MANFMMIICNIYPIPFCHRHLLLHLSTHAACCAEAQVEWTPSRAGWQTAPPARKRTVPSLSRLCVLTVADCIDYVESLRGLPQVYLVRLRRAVQPGWVPDE